MISPKEKAQIKKGSRIEPWDKPIFTSLRNNEKPIRQTEKEQPVK